MALPNMASAVELPDLEPLGSNAPSTKKRPANEDAELQENKRTKTSPGKKSPPKQSSTPASQDQQESQSPAQSHAPISKTEKVEDRAPGFARKKNVNPEEKARLKRLFGGLPLFGAARPARDRNATKRQEIESRKQAELQQQDAARLEGNQKRKERLRDSRLQRQVALDRDAMRVRHKDELYKAGFLRTNTQPQLFYRPYILSDREDDQIDRQVRATKDKIDRDLKRPTSSSSRDSGRSPAPPKGAKTLVSTVEKAPETDQTEAKQDGDGDAQEGAQPSPEPPEDKPDVEMSSDKEKGSAAPSPTDQDPTAVEEPEPKQTGEAEGDEGDHVVVEGDEDTVSY